MLLSQFGLCYVPQASDSTTNDLQEVTSRLLADSALNSAFSNLATLYSITTSCITFPVTKGTVECRFSDMRQVKTRLRSHPEKNILDQAMPQCIEDPCTLSDDELRTIVTHSKA